MEKLADFFNSLAFSAPLYLWVAGALVLLLIFLPWFGRKKRLAIDLQYWGDKVNLKSRRFLILSIPVLITSILLVGVLSNPKVTEKPITDIYGYPVMIVIDVSGSMAVDSMYQTSFDEALEAFNDLVARRSDMNFGLLIFSSESYVARYFINKNELFLDTLENKEEIVYLSRTTHIAEALRKAYVFLTENIEGDDKAIILISDLYVASGEWPSIVTEMNIISLANINLYIIATKDGKKNETYIPEISGLKIVDLQDKGGIDQICEEISAMQMSLIREEEGLSEKSLTPFLALLTLGLIVFSLVLDETRYRKIP